MKLLGIEPRYLVRSIIQWSISNYGPWANNNPNSGGHQRNHQFPEVETSLK